MIRFLYNLLFPLGLLIYLPTFLRKMFRRGNYRERFGERLGLYSKETRLRLARRRPIWMHAVSVGEAAVALKLVGRIKKLDSDFSCVLTVTTTTGFAFARKESPDGVEVLYSPLDFWPVTRRFFSLVQPAKIILIEAEVWPNMMAEARLRGIPVALVNARLSARSERRFRRFRFLVAPIFRRLDLVCIPEANDIPRWARLGVNPSVISLTGNIKYDTVETSFDAEGPRKILNSIGIDIKCPIIFGGSTHPGEEMILARVFSKLRGEFPSLVLVIAPRHVERAREIRASLEKLSLRVAIRSETGGARPDCLLIDTTGELRNWYSVATVVFVGKSLAVHGGQNPVEAIVAGKPVIFGPHMENFETLARSLVEHRGAIQIGDEQSLEDEAGRLLRDQMSRQELVIKAAEVLAAHRDATATTAALVTNLKSHTTLREDPTGKLLATP